VKIDLKNLSVAKSHPEKTLLAPAMKHRTSGSNAWLAEHLTMGQPPSSVSSHGAGCCTLRDAEAVEELLAGEASR
jgi:hypothetical protein